MVKQNIKQKPLIVVIYSHPIAGIKDGILMPFVRESIRLNLPLNWRIKQPQVKTSTSVD